MSPRARTTGVPLLRPAAAVVLASLALGAAGCAASAKPGTASGSRPRVWRPSAPDSLGPTVALVGERRITRHDVDSLLAGMPEDQRQSYRTPEGYRKVVDHLVEREMALQAARQAGTDRDSSYRAELASAARDLLVRHYFRSKFNRMPAISDSAVRAHYDAHLEEYAVPARARIGHIQVATKSKARDVLRRLKRGGSWDAVCAATSTDASTKTNGGMLGYVSQGSEMVPLLGNAPAVVEAAFSLAEGATSDPIQVGGAWHLIRLDALERGTTRSFESVRAGIAAELRGRQREEYGMALRDSLKEATGVVVFDDSIRVALLPGRTAATLFEEAQAAIDPTQRIDLYRQLIARYPDDKAAMQALFMVGFTYAEELGDYDEARAALGEFLQKYPDSDLAGSAQWMVENMDRPNPTFEEEAPADSAAGVPPGGGKPGPAHPPHTGGAGTPGGVK